MRKLAIATPARTRLVADARRPNTADAVGQHDGDERPAERSERYRRRARSRRVPAPATIATVAPRPAPAATPRRYGSASGLRNAPWYDAPATESIAPTITPMATRGARISQTVARLQLRQPAVDRDERQAVEELADDAAHGSEHRTRSSSPASHGSDEDQAQATAVQRTVWRRVDHRTVRQDRGRCRHQLTGTVAIAVGDRLKKLDDPRTPSRGDVVVELDHASRSARPTARTNPGRAATVSADSPQHFVSARKISDGILLEEVLRRQLRIARAVVDGVGDVHEPERRVHLTDEGRRRHREQRVVELVVVGQRLVGSGTVATMSSMSLSACRPRRRRLADVTGGRADLLDLRVRVVDASPRPGRGITGMSSACSPLTTLLRSSDTTTRSGS